MRWGCAARGAWICRVWYDAGRGVRVSRHKIWRKAVREFISEDDLNTFEGWLRYQGVDSATAADELEMWRKIYNERSQGSSDKVGLMKLRSIPGEHRYAVAVKEGADLWLTLWVRRSPKGEFFVLIPRATKGWNPHTSYHLNGMLHMKSFDDYKVISQMRQPLTGVFRGTEHLGAHGGHGPKTVGAICNPDDFSGVVEVAPGMLGPVHGTVVVDLVEPDCKPLCWPGTLVAQQVFRDFLPWVVIRIYK
jgi:hypothetical protein